MENLNIPTEWLILLISAVPILEQKAAIPIGLAENLNYVSIYIYTLIGAILPSPFIILLLTKIFDLLKKYPLFRPLIQWVEERTLKKGKNIVKYELLGLFLFVAIPLPGTGVWTGSMAAALLRLRFKYSFPMVCLGAAVCGAIILFSGHGILSFFK